MAQAWRVPPLWAGEAAVVVAGGPSLTRAQVDHCRGRARVLVINDGYRLAPWADLLYFCDKRWYAWHEARPEFRAFEGRRVTLDNIELPAKSIRNMGWNPRQGKCGLYPEPDGVYNGRNGGYQALCLAVHLGAKRILLLGYDMKAAEAARSHWFGDHPIETKPRVFADTMRPCFDHLVAPLKERGVEVINCTPGSALACWPMRDLTQAL